MQKAALQKLKRYFVDKDDVLMAFLFGSRSKGMAHKESDVDVAVYVRPVKDGASLEVESEVDYTKVASQMASDVSDILKEDAVDVVVLNNAAPSVAFEAMRSGVPLVIKDRALYLSFLCKVSFEAIDFWRTTEEFLTIRERSASLSEPDRQRLVQVLTFLEKELSEHAHFANLTWDVYLKDSDKRRSAERWAENIVNASIDIAKILLASEKQKAPYGYKDMLKNLVVLSGFDSAQAARLAGNAGFRNILAHEYFDIRFEQLKRFIDSAEKLYGYLTTFTKAFLSKEEKK